MVFLLVGIMFPLGSAELWERVIATDSLRDLKTSLIIASSSYFIFGLLLAGVCINLSETYSGVGTDTRLVVGLSRSLPQYLSGLVIVAFASAILSSADTFIFSTSTLFGHSLRNPQKYGVNRTASFVRNLTIPVTTAGLIFAILFHNIIDVTYYFASLTLGLGTLTLVIWIRENVPARAVNLAVYALFATVSITSLAVGVSNLLPILGILSVLVTVMLLSLIKRK